GRDREKARPGGTVTTAGGCPPRHCGRRLFTFPDSPKEASTVCGPRRRRRSLSISSANGRGKCAGCCKKEGPKNIARNHVDYIEGDIASEIVGIGQMVLRCGGALNTIANMSMNTPTYAYAYKYAAFDGLRRIAAAGKEARDESAKRLSQKL